MSLQKCDMSINVNGTEVFINGVLIADTADVNSPTDIMFEEERAEKLADALDIVTDLYYRGRFEFDKSDSEEDSRIKQLGREVAEYFT